MTSLMTATILYADCGPSNCSWLFCHSKYTMLVVDTASDINLCLFIRFSCILMVIFANFNIKSLIIITQAIYLQHSCVALFSAPPLLSWHLSLILSFSLFLLLLSHFALTVIFPSFSSF